MSDKNDQKTQDMSDKARCVRQKLHKIARYVRQMCHTKMKTKCKICLTGHNYNFQAFRRVFKLLIPISTGSVTRVTPRAMGENEKALFDRALSAVSWEPLFRLETCEEQYAYYQTMIDSLMEMCFPYKVVTRHSADKPWVTDGFRLLVRKRQRAHMSGNFVQEKILRNKVNRAATKLRYDFYQKHVTALSDTGSHDWWKSMKKLMGIEANDS